jgi:hypothetical protein
MTSPPRNRIGIYSGAGRGIMTVPPSSRLASDSRCSGAQSAKAALSEVSAARWAMTDLPRKASEILRSALLLYRASQ